MASDCRNTVEFVDYLCVFDQAACVRGLVNSRSQQQEQKSVLSGP